MSENAADHQGKVTVNDFFDAIDKGDAVAAANVLRQLDSLSRSSLSQLADLFDGTGGNKYVTPYVIELKYVGGVGRPPKITRFDQRFNQMDIYHAVCSRKHEFKKEMAAIKAAAEKYGWDEPTVRKAYYEEKKRRKQSFPKSP
jgi:hypothetical protein